MKLIVRRRKSEDVVIDLEDVSDIQIELDSPKGFKSIDTGGIVKDDKNEPRDLISQC
jgi:hypothetical protein